MESVTRGLPGLAERIWLQLERARLLAGEGVALLECEARRLREAVQVRFERFRAEVLTDQQLANAGALLLR